MKVSFEFKKEDLWVGAYWRACYPGTLDAKQFDVWVCLIPMVPIHLSWRKPMPEAQVYRELGLTLKEN